MIKDYAGSRALVGVCVHGGAVLCFRTREPNNDEVEVNYRLYRLIAGWNVEIIKALKQSISFTYIHVRRGRGETRIRKNFKSFEKCNFFFN